MKQSAVILFSCLTMSLCWSAWSQPTDPKVQPPPSGKIPGALIKLGPNTHHAFVVDKELRTLSLWKNSNPPTLVAAFPTDIGKNKGNKLYQGDHKTPEGIYFFQEAYEQPHLDFSLYGNRAFTMNYPNHFDLMEKKTGGGIWLHAIPDTQTLTRGSRGCVVVRNEIIDQLKKFIELKNTPIVVQNNVEYLSLSEWTTQKEKAEKWINDWKAAWESKEFDSYISHYNEKFKSMGMNYKKWKAHKEALAQRYSFIKVGVDQLDILKNGPQYIFRFVQDYKSDQNQDLGEKHLYVLSREDGSLQIVGEEWSPLKDRFLSGR